MRSDTPWDSDLSHISWSLPLHGVPCPMRQMGVTHWLGQWPITYKLELASTLPMSNDKYMELASTWSLPDNIYIYPCPMRQMRSDTPWDSDLSHISYTHVQDIETNFLPQEWHYIYPWQWPITYKLDLQSHWHVQWCRGEPCPMRDKWGVTTLGQDLGWSLPLQRSDTPWDSDLSHISWSLPLHIPMSNETNEEWHTLGQWPTPC